MTLSIGDSILLVICAIVFIGGILWLVRWFIDDAKLNKELRNTKDSELPKLNQKIDAVYRLFFGDSTITREEKLEQLFRSSMQMLDDAKQQYLTSNSISKTADTFSDLGKCGVSQTRLYTKVDEFAFDYNPAYKSIGLYRDIQRSKYGFEKHYDYIYSVLNVYSELKQNGVKKISSMEIDLNQLLYYKIEGTVQHVSNVSGGGVNLQGAVAGAIIGGGAAAIIGSQIGTETKTDIVTKDDRKITFYLNGSDGLVTYDVVSRNYDRTIAALRKLIPDKEESVVQMKARTSSTTAVSSVTDEIKKFKELLDNGIISQEEFDAKKKQMLGL